MPNFLKKFYILAGVLSLSLNLRVFRSKSNRNAKSGAGYFCASRASLNILVMELGTSTFMFSDRPLRSVQIKLASSRSWAIEKLVCTDAYPKRYIYLLNSQSISSNYWNESSKIAFKFSLNSICIATASLRVMNFNDAYVLFSKLYILTTNSSFARLKMVYRSSFSFVGLSVDMKKHILNSSCLSEGMSLVSWLKCYVNLQPLWQIMASNLSPSLMGSPKLKSRSNLSTLLFLLRLVRSTPAF